MRGLGPSLQQKLGASKSGASKSEGQQVRMKGKGVTRMCERTWTVGRLFKKNCRSENCQGVKVEWEETRTMKLGESELMLARRFRLLPAADCPELRRFSPPSISEQASACWYASRGPASHTTDNRMWMHGAENGYQVSCMNSSETKGSAHSVCHPLWGDNGYT